MNWRLGLFRLWVLASAIWITFTSIALVPAVIDVPHSIMLTHGADKLKFPGNTPRPVMAKALADYLKEKDSLWPGTRYPPVDYDVEATKIMDATGYKPTNYSEPALRLIGFALGPPIAALAIGFSAVWVIAGFKIVRKPN